MFQNLCLDVLKYKNHIELEEVSKKIYRVMFIVALPIIIFAFLFVNYKNNNLEIGIDLKEIILFNLFLVAFILLMESRIGVVGYLFTISLSSLYFLKLKKIYFKFFITNNSCSSGLEPSE